MLHESTAKEKKSRLINRAIENKSETLIFKAGFLLWKKALGDS